MSWPISFVVFGRPVPQGSTRAFIPKGWKRPVITAANAKTKPWRQEIAGIAAGEMSQPASREVGLTVAMDFYLARPKSLPKKQLSMTKKPDIDKLARAVLDALTGIVFEDDSQVIHVSARKSYGMPERVEITVGP